MVRTKTFKFPVFTEEEYLNIVLEHLKVSVPDLIRGGFPKWCGTYPEPFINAVFTTYSIDPKILPSQFILDLGDTKYVYLVSCSNSMLIDR